MTPDVLSRLKGCMIGGLVGDCLGAPFECQYTSLVPISKIDRFIQRLRDETPEEALQYTDDTAMARQVAASFIDKNSLDVKDMAKRFVKEYFDEEWRGYGASVRDVFLKLRSSECSEPHGPASEQFNGSGSFGNGAGMRTHPIAMFFIDKDIDYIVEVAKQVAKITHAHPLGVNGGVLQAVAVHQALNGASGDSIMETVANTAAKLEEEYECDTASTYVNKMDLVKEYLDKPDDDLDEACFELGNDVSAVDSVPTALFCFLRAEKLWKEEGAERQFEETLKLGIRMGGDTDTIASMACAIAGAAIGQVPGFLSKGCEALEEVENMAQEIYKLVKNKKGDGENGEIKCDSGEVKSDSANGEVKSDFVNGEVKACDKENEGCHTNEPLAKKQKL